MGPIRASLDRICSGMLGRIPKGSLSGIGHYPRPDPGDQTKGQLIQVQVPQ